MTTSSRFAVAVHMLSLLARENGSLTSADMARSVNTNPVVIRRLLRALHHAGLVSTRLGADGGATLTRPPGRVTLLEIYQATEHAGLFGLHRTPPNPRCACGRTIQPVLGDVFRRAETAATAVLGDTTLADIVAEMATRLDAEREA